jgi:hypothetical protein
MDIPNVVYSHHDDRCEDDIGQDDTGHDDESFDVEEMRCAMLCWCVATKKKQELWCGTTSNASWYKWNDNSEKVEDDFNKKSNKRQGQKRKNVTHDQEIEGSKERKVSALVMWYIPVIDRLKYMFSNPRDVELLLWHLKHKTNGKIQHLVDGRQWKYPRNIRFELSTYGMNPFEEMRNPHCTLPVIMCIFNLPYCCVTNESIFYWQLSYLVLNKLALIYMFFRTIDGGHAKTLGIWGHYMGWVHQTTLQSKGHYFIHDQWQSRTLIPYRAGQRKDIMYRLCGLDRINLSSIFQ